MYSVFLLKNDLYDESTFEKFLNENFNEVCPAGGVITCEDGNVNCSLHQDATDNKEQPPRDEVPWL
jgi:hypothetical protein